MKQEDILPTTRDNPPTAIEQEQIKKKMIYVQYRGKCIDNYVRELHKINAPCTIVMTICKLSTTLPSLKPQIETQT